MHATRVWPGEQQCMVSPAQNTGGRQRICCVLKQNAAMFCRDLSVVNTFAVGAAAFALSLSVYNLRVRPHLTRIGTSSFYMSTYQDSPAATRIGR